MTPIRPEMRALYPPDWDKITARIRARAGDRCECLGECGHDHRAELADQAWIELVGDEEIREWVGPELGRCLAEQHRPHPVTAARVVLTTAHLNHDPADCRPENLKAMCQRCHLAYDAERHAETRSATQHAARLAAGQTELDLPEVTPAPDDPAR